MGNHLTEKIAKLKKENEELKARIAELEEVANTPVPVIVEEPKVEE